MKTDKTPTDEPPTGKPRKLPRKAVILTILLVLLASLIYIFASYRAQQVNQQEEQAALAADKARFAKVETDMARAYDAIVAAAGRPDKVEQHKSCSQVAFKYDEGELWCARGYSLVYNSNDEASVPKLTKRIKDAIQSTTSFIIGTDVASHARHNETELNDNQHVNYRGDNRLKCELMQDYKDTKTSVGLEGISTDKAVSYLFRCSKTVKTPIYTLEQ